MPDVLKPSWLFVAAAMVGAPAGCNATLTVQYYPSFYDPELKTVAVVPFANRTLHAKAGEFLTERLAEALKANGTYQVIAPGELKARLSGARLTLPDGADANTIAAALGKLGGVQAFLTGTVTGFAAGQGSYAEVWDDDWYGPGWGWAYGYRRRHWGYGMGGWHRTYRRYVYTHAHVAARASLVRVADGKTIHVTPAPLAARVRSFNEPPKLPDELLAEAADAVADGLVREFAVAPMRVKIDKGKTLRTARRRPGGELDFTNDFRAAADEMVVVLRLPPEAARNAFRLVIARKKQPQPLAEETFTWSAKDDTRQFAFSPRGLVEAAGPGQFELRLYCNDRLVLRRGLRIDKD
jgi:hypothetical protein